MVQRLTRQELFDLVWSGPMRSVATTLGLSDVGLRKIVENARLPIPPQGHWNKVLAGKKTVAQPTIPPRGFGAGEYIYFGSDRWAVQRARWQSPSDEPPPAPVFSESMDSVRSRAQKAVGRVLVARDLRITHPAFRQILADEERRAEKVRNNRWALSFEGPQFSAPVDQRRLQLLNAICLGVAKAGLKPKVWRRDLPVIYVESDEVKIPIIARTTSKKAKEEGVVPRLSIIAGEVPDYGGKAIASWQDTDQHRLEGIMTDIVLDLVVLVEQRYRDNQVESHQRMLDAIAREAEERRKAKIEAERKERERQERLARERIERLLGEADQLRKASAIRDYVAQVEALHASNDTSAPAQQFSAWRIWALAQADAIDPVKTGAFLRGLEQSDGQE